MSWDSVEVGLAGGEETVTFGPRNETGSALYQVDTLASVSPREKVDQLPKIFSTSSQDGFCAVISKQVLLFNSSCTVLHATLNFDSDVDKAAFSEDSTFMAIGERSGKFHFLHVASQQILFSQDLVSTTEADVNETSFLDMFFTLPKADGSEGLVILSTTGLLFEFSCLKLQELHEAIDSQDLSQVKNLKEPIVTKCSSMKEAHQEVLAGLTTASHMGTSAFITYGKESNMAVWGTNPREKDNLKTVLLDTIESFTLSSGVLKACTSCDGSFLVILDEQNLLSLWDIESLTLMVFWNHLVVEDFLLVSSSGVQASTSSSEEELKIIILTKPTEIKEKHFLQVYTLPSMNQIYSLQVSDTCNLARSPSSQETIYFIEGVSSRNGYEDDNTALRIRCLTEALPENRFYRLLHKHQFDGAEKFARQFGLDVELVFKVKANTLLDKVSLWSNYKDQEEFSVNELKDCFAKIKDDEYVANCCLQAVLPTMEDTYDMLRYARERVTQNYMANGITYSPTKLLQEILPALDKLATFEMAYGIQNFSGARWHSFCNADLLAEVWRCLEHGEICSAVTIWRRHQSLFEKDFSTDKLESLLGSIRQDLRSSHIVPWLRDDLVPFVVRVLPQGIDTLASWLEQRARKMELTEKYGWPANSLELASVLQAPSTCASTAKQKQNEKNKQNGLSRLADLVRHLRELLDLHTKYSCRIGLAEFSKETTRTLVFRLLDSVKAAELLSQAMNKYIFPYMIHHSLDQDQVLRDYVKEMFLKLSGSYSSLSNSLWEARVIAVITYIKDKQAYCQATLEVMRHALVPWSDVVDNLVQDAMTAYPNNLELKEQYRFVELKKVLRLYGMRSTQVPDAAKAKSIVRTILTRDEPTAMEDALKVVQAYSHLSESDVYVFRLQKLCLDERVMECVDILNSLPKNKAAQYAEEIIIWLCRILQEERFAELDSTKERIVAAQNAVSILKFIKKRELLTYHEVDELLPDLLNISALQREFSEFYSLDDYRDSTRRNELFQRYFGLYFQGDNTPQDKKPEKPITLTRLTRLCNLILITKEDLMTRLADHALLSGDTQRALEICRDLLEYAAQSSTSHSLYTIAHALCKRMAEGLGLLADANKNTPKTNLTKEIYQLLCRILNLCQPDLLCDCLELCKCIALANEVYAQCETGDYGFSVKTTANSSMKDLLSEWTFDKRFKEDGLVLDSVCALPLAGKFSIASVPDGCKSNSGQLYYQARVAGRSTSDQENKEKDEKEMVPMPSRLIQVSSAGLNIIKYLQENNLYKLALRYACETLGVCLQHYAANSLIVDKESATASASGIASEKQHLAKISVMGLNITMELIGGLLVKVFNYKTVDHDLGLGYVCSIPKQLALEKMRSRALFPAQNYGKVVALADVVIDFACLSNEPLVLENYKKILSNAVWGQKLSKMKIYVKDVYKLDCEEMYHRVLPDLIQNKDINLQILLDFCKTFNADEEEALLMYIKMQLLPAVATDTDNQSDHVDTPEYELNVRAAVPHISSERLLQLLVHVASKVDPYDYNKILFILNLTTEHAPSDAISTVEKGIQLLEYLSHYQRKSPPNKYEKTFSYSINTEDKDKMSMTSEKPLSLLSKERLPFHPLLYGDPWKVISAELSEDTVPKLIGVAKLLKLSTDQMYLTAIQNLFKSAQTLKRGSGSSESPLDETVNDADSADSLKRFDFERAKGLLYSVKNKEMAIAAAKWIAQQLPLGEEKIKVLETCVDLANDWQSNCTPEEAKKAKMTYNRLKDLSRGIATEHVLHKYDIAEPSLVAMIPQPAKLICQLYENYGARDIGVSNQPPDINKASDEIAAINDSSISRIRLYLIEKWLPSSPVTSESAVTECTDQALMGFSEHSEDAENLKRVVYVLQSSPVERNIIFLLNFAYKEMSSASITSLCRLRSLHALFAIAQDDVIVEVSKKPIDSIRQYMTSLTYLAELEALHIQQSLSAFQKCNKEGLVRGLWRNHNHEKRAVRLVTDLCLVNKIHDPQLWNSVLQQLLSFGMIKYLRRVLVSLAAVPELWQVPCLPNVWRSVLLAPFKSVSLPLSDDELKSCTESAALLQRCPLLLDLNLEVIAGHFHRVGLHAYALACLILIPSNKTRREKIKGLLETKCAVTILDQLQLQQEHAQALSHVKMIEQEVFQYVENNLEYELLLGTVHFDKMVRVLVSIDQIDGLLIKTLKANRIEDAVKLVRLYYQAYPESTSGRYASQSDQLNGLEELWVFLELRHKLEEALPYLPQREEKENSELSDSKQNTTTNESNYSEIYEHE